MTARYLMIVLTGCLLLQGAGGQSIDSLFDAAHEAYRSGDYSTAVGSYEVIIARGEVSGALYYNLGNSYFRTGNVARAILAYERAQRIDPTDDDIQHNLDMARLRTIDRIDPLPELFLVTWVRLVNAALPIGVTAWVFLVGWCVIFGSLMAMYLIRSATVVRIMRSTFFLGSAAALVFGVLLIVQVFVTPQTADGIIMTPTVTAKSSPDAESVDAFVVHEGLKVSLGDHVGEWIRITLADGKTGWIRSAEVEQV